MKEATMAVMTLDQVVARGSSAPRHLALDDVAAHPLLRATAWSSAIGLVAGLVLGLVTQAQEHDRG
jgi:hypothetical protein